MEIEQQIQSEDGRLMILQVQVDNLKLACANIHTLNDTCSQITFIRHVQNLLQQFSGENIIFYISQNFIMAHFAAFERSKLYQTFTTASISP